MKELFIVANWKSHKTIPEAKSWLDDMIENKEVLDGLVDKTIIVCAPFTLLSFLKQYIDEHDLPIKLGAQDISIFDEGAYTGEINGKQIREFAEYVIIGHSERRENFKEDYELLKVKVEQARKYDLEPIFCVQGDDTPLPENISIVAYEPVSAIGTGNPDSPENANHVADVYRNQKSIYYVLYGGSVKPENAKSFTLQPHISGHLIGGASLVSKEFLEIIRNA